MCPRRDVNEPSHVPVRRLYSRSQPCRTAAAQCGKGQPKRGRRRERRNAALAYWRGCTSGVSTPVKEPLRLYVGLISTRENRVATKHTSTDGLRQTLAALAISAALFAACGSTTQALSGAAQNEQRASVVHDPSNPYWVGSDPYASGLAAGTPSVTRATIIHDPENPYWQMSKAQAHVYADPVRGDH
jgi:hypothetical protein